MLLPHLQPAEAGDSPTIAGPTRRYGFETARKPCLTRLIFLEQRLEKVLAHLRDWFVTSFSPFYGFPSLRNLWIYCCQRSVLCMPQDGGLPCRMASERPITALPGESAQIRSNHYAISESLQRCVDISVIDTHIQWRERIVINYVMCKNWKSQ